MLIRAATRQAVAAIVLLAVALGSVAFFVTGALYSPAAAIAVTAGLTGLAANYLVRGAPPTALTKTMKPR